MSNPVAAHTFDFKRVYLSTRSSGAPGSGVWTTPVVIFDGTLDNANFAEAGTISAGGLNSGDPRGILCFTTSNNDNDLSFLGDGDPTAPLYITFPSQQIALTPGPGYWNTAHGAWTYGGAKWAAVINNKGGGRVPTIIKSADGSSPWAIQDGSNGPTGITGMGNIGDQVAVQQIDTYIFIFCRVDGSDNFQIFPFNMATGLWETASTAANIPNFNNFGLNAGGGSQYWSNGLIKFTNGNFAVFYSSNTGPGPVFQLLTGGLSGSWGGEVALPGNNYFANCVIDDTPALVHVLTFQGANTATQVNYCTVDQDGTLVNTGINIAACVGSSDGVGHCSIQNGMLFVPRDDTNDFDNSVWVATLPVVSFSKETLPIPPGETGQILAAGPGGSLGSGYLVGDTGTIDGGESGYSAGYSILGVHNNIIDAWSIGGILSLGSGYAVGDTFTIAGGSTLATAQVLTIGGGGAVASIGLLTLGAGYSTGVTTTNATSGGGSGLQFDVVSVINGVSEVQIFPNGGGYSVANNVTTTPGGSQPGVGSGLQIDILQVGGKTPSCAYMMFPNGYSRNPGTCTITVTAGSGPCDNVVPVPATDVQFKLIKCIATLKPETHLPVRGSVK